MASDCAVDTARSAAICSPSSSTPRLPPTTTAVNANCGPPRPTARSPAASAPNGARTCSPPSAPSSAPHSDAEWTPIRRSKPPYTAAQRSNRVEQIPPFNVGKVLQTTDFGKPQIEMLNYRHGSPIGSESDLQK